VKVRLLPLRERPEEVPYLVEMGIARFEGMTAHATLYEECLLRAWCGTNVRGLLAALTSAALAARAAKTTQVMASHLPPRAPSDVWPSHPSVRTGSIAPPLGPDEERCSRAYEQHGEIEKAAAAIGKSRTWGYETHRRLFGPKR
jgi:DNA-binding NtrC family response regulator